MKEKKEKKTTDVGNEKKRVVEEEKNNDVQKKMSQEDSDQKTSMMEAWVPFLTKFIKVMIAIEDLQEAKKAMESDPYFVYVMKKFMEFKEKYEAEHPEVMEEVDDDYECEDEELFDMVKQMKDNLQAHGISVKVRKVTDPAEVEKFERFMKGTPAKNGASKMAEA